MRQIYRIEKRLPFGFRGDWGKVYKRYTFDEKLVVDDINVIDFQDNSYVDIGQDVQFKKVESRQKRTEQPVDGSLANSVTIYAETTDACWNSNCRAYECIVSTDDIVQVFGKRWIVAGMQTKSIYTPTPQETYTCELKLLEDKKNG